MSSQMMVKAWETTNLTPAERLVLMALADCADRDGANAFRSERTMAEHTQLSLRTIKRALQALKVKGHVRIQELPTNRRSTTYQLFPATAAMGANVTPPSESSTARRGGDTASPLRGANVTPLGVTSGVTFRTAGGDKSSFPPTPPYKEEPVKDPVEPGAVSLLAKLAEDILQGLDGHSRSAHLESLRRAAKARRWPHDEATLDAALDAWQAARRRAS